MHKARGFFITLEGLDGSGKTTQMRRLAAHLRVRNIAVTEMRQPGGTMLGDQLRSLLLAVRDESPVAPMTELTLMFADRAQAITEVVQPALDRGDILLCDRWTDSTEAYQGGGRQLGESLVHALDAAVCGELKPDLTLLLLPPLDVSLARARRRNARHHARTGEDESRFETEERVFFERVWTQYTAIAARDRLRVVTIDDDSGIDAVHARIVSVVEERLGAHGFMPAS